jgi:hypothetical protein
VPLADGFTARMALIVTVTGLFGFAGKMELEIKCGAL